jgi:peptidyl-prolyl cis-trans isomerase SurA
VVVTLVKQALRSLFILPAIFGAGLAVAADAPPTLRAAPPQPQAAPGVAIAAVVNEDIITQFDVQSRIGLIIATSGLDDTPEIQRRLAPQVVDSLIDDHLKRQEARRLKIESTEAEVRQAVDNIELRNNMQPGAFREMLTSKGIDMSVLYAQLEADLMWVKVVRQSLESQVSVGPDEINAVLARAKANQGKTEYLVGEIALPVPTPPQEQIVRDLANRLVQQARSGAPFQALAQQFSQSPTAALGGDLGWVVKGDMDAELDDAVTRLEPGQISEPIRTSTGYHILTLREKRTAGAPDPLMTAITLSQIFLPTTGGRALPADRMAELSARIAGLTTCEEMNKVAAEIETPGSGPTMPIYMAALPEKIREVVLPLQPGRTSPAIDVDSAKLYVQVCQRREDTGVPSADMIQQNIENEKLQNAARQRLRDLRRQALVDVRI